MLNKIHDEYRKLKGIVKTNTFSIIDTKKLTYVVIKTKDNEYLCFYKVDFLKFDYVYNSVYVHDINNGYNEKIDNDVIDIITIL